MTAAATVENENGVIVEFKMKKNKRGSVKRVGDYAMGKTIGAGGFCKVKSAVHLLTGETVAVKIFDKDALAQQEGAGGVDQLEQENQILGMLHNDHIVQLYEVINTNKFMYIVMEHAAGGELFDYIVAHGHLQEFEACQLIHQILHAVEYCHKHGVVHRDLKPENLLLDETRHIKLVDFGLADRWGGAPGERLTGLEHGGSPSYLAPEIIVDDPNVIIGPAVDIWAIGVVAYALLIGGLPFNGKSDAEGNEDLSSLFEAIVRCRLRPPPYLSAEAQEFLKNVLHPDPARRWTAEQVRGCAWWAMCMDGEDEAGSREKEREPVRDDVVEAMANFGPDYASAGDVKKALEAGASNKLCATYYLLLRKMKRERVNDEEVRKAFDARHAPRTPRDGASFVSSAGRTSTASEDTAATAAAPAAAAAAAAAANAPAAADTGVAPTSPGTSSPRVSFASGAGAGGGGSTTNLGMLLSPTSVAVAGGGAVVEGGHRHDVAARQHHRGSVSHAHVDNPREAIAELEAVMRGMGMEVKQAAPLWLKVQHKARGVRFELLITREGTSGPASGSSPVPPRRHAAPPKSAAGGGEGGENAGDGSSSSSDTKYVLKVKRVAGDSWDFHALTRLVLESAAGVLQLHHMRANLDVAPTPRASDAMSKPRGFREEEVAGAAIAEVGEEGEVVSKEEEAEPIIDATTTATKQEASELATRPPDPVVAAN